MAEVIKMPDLLERRAQKIEAALDRQDMANARTEEATRDWREATLELAVELASVKLEMNNNDRAFGAWCDKRFGGNRINTNDRAALVRWGADPDGTRKMLAKEDSRSIQMIDRRFCNATKPPKAPAPDTPKRIEAADAIRAHVSVHGKVPTVQEAMKASGLSRIVVEPALATVKAENRIAPSTHTYTKAQEHHVEARVKVEVKAAMEQLHKSFESEVQKRNKADIDRLFPDLEKLRESAALNERHYREMIEKEAIFTETEFTTILTCLHPDNSASKEKRDTAFKAFHAVKLKLTGKK